MNEEHSTTDKLAKRIPLPEKLTLLRWKLNDKAKREPKFRFYALYDRVYREDTLQAAWQLVKSNRGRAGVDGKSISSIINDLENGGVSGFLYRIGEDLKNKTYHPSAVKRVYIPKSNGKLRPLGIPTVRDRVVQMAVLLILEPIFEADFLDCSYGYRPGKSAHDALFQIQKNIKEGYTSIYDSDLKGYFDSIPHDRVMKCLEQRVSDRSVLSLIRKWLKAPIEEEKGGKKRVSGSGTKGTPQGGVISPLLANLYLHYFDRSFHRQSGAGGWGGARLVRYADDFVVMARSWNASLSEWIETKIEGWLGLEINREKTKIVELRKNKARLDFLSYSFRFDVSIKHKDKRKYLNMFPSRASVQEEIDQLRDILSKENRYKPVPELVKEVNRQLKGWSSYFSIGYPRMAYRKVNYYLEEKLYFHLRRRGQKGYKFPKDRSSHVFKKELGFEFL